MRILSLLTAIGAVALLFLVVFERDMLREFAGYEPEAAVASAPAEAEPEAETPVGVSVIAIDSKAVEIENGVVLRGRTEAARQVALLAETAGRVVSQPRPKGTLVATGDRLCEIDMGARGAVLAEAKARLAEAEANVASVAARVTQAEAALEEADLNLRNVESLAGSGHASETRVVSARAARAAANAALTAAQAGHASATAAIESATAAVAKVERDIANTEVFAPFGGVLETDTAELGSLLQPGAPCANLIDLDPIILVGFVSEVDVDRIVPGAPAAARLASGREVIGRVTFLSRAADPATRTFRVEAEAPNPDLAIRDGQTAEIIVQSQGRLAHLVPQSALTLDDAGTLGVRLAVAEPQGDTARFAPVELLRDSPDGIWIDGLPPEARIIVVGQGYVSDGALLHVTLREAGS